MSMHFCSSVLREFRIVFCLMLGLALSPVFLSSTASGKAVIYSGTERCGWIYGNAPTADGALYHPGSLVVYKY